MVKMSAGEILSKRSAVEILICMKSVIERSADGAPFDQREPAVEINDDKKEVIDKKKTFDRKKCWRNPIVLRSAVDFDAYKIIFTHSFHYSPPYFSLVKLIFFFLLIQVYSPYAIYIDYDRLVV